MMHLLHGVTRPAAWKQVALLVMALAWGVRLWGLDAYAIGHDEAWHLLVIREPLAAIWNIIAPDPNPPLYYVLPHFLPWLTDSNYGARVLAVSFNVLTVGVGMLLARRLFGGQAGLVAGLLLALSPPQIEYARGIKMYSLHMLLSLTASYCLWRALLEARRWVWWFGFVAASALNFYTLYVAFFVLLAQNVFVLWHYARQTGPTLAGLARALRPWCVSQLAILALFLPYLPRFYGQAQNVAAGWGFPFPTPLHLILVYTTFLFTWPQFTLVGVGCLFFGLIVFCLVVAQAMRHSSRGDGAYLYCLLILLLPALAMYLISLRSPFLVPWLAVGSSAFVYVLLAHQMRRGGAALPLISSYVALLIFASLQLAADVAVRPDARGVASYLLGNVSADDDVVVHLRDLTYYPTYWDSPRLPQRVLHLGWASIQLGLADRGGLPVSYPQSPSGVGLPAVATTSRGDLSPRLWLVVSSEDEMDTANPDLGWFRERYDVLPALQVRYITVLRLDLKTLAAGRGAGGEGRWYQRLAAMEGVSATRDPAD